MDYRHNHKHQLKLPEKIAIVSIGLLTFFVFFLIILIGIRMESDKKRAAERHIIDNQASIYQSRLEKEIFSRIMLSKGLVAYISTHPDFTVDEVNRYLEQLKDSDDLVLRHIAVLKDTTIIYLYPLAGNEKAMHADLAAVPGQKEYVLSTKENLTMSAQGPVELIQGGQAVVIRIPIIDEEGNYWGQTSTVLRLEKLICRVGLNQTECPIEFALYNDDAKDKKPFWGDLGMDNKDPVHHKINIDGLRWTIAAIPKGGWQHSNSISYGIVLLMLLIFPLPAGILAGLLAASRFRLRHKAMHDYLTELPNRAFLDSYMGVILARAERSQDKIAILFIDVDKFKAINDQGGHRMGDAVLKFVADALRKAVRKSEAVIRLGGDEFIIILEGIHSRDELKNIFARIREATEHPFVFEETEIPIAVSIGEAIYPDDGENMDELIRLADKRMYQEKQLKSDHDIS